MNDNILLREDRLAAENADLRAELTRQGREQANMAQVCYKYRREIAQLRAELAQVKPQWKDAPEDATRLWIQWQWADDAWLTLGEGGYQERRPAEVAE